MTNPGFLTDGHGNKSDVTPLKADQVLDVMRKPHILINPGKVTIVLVDKQLYPLDPESDEDFDRQYQILDAINDALLLAQALKGA